MGAVHRQVRDSDAQLDPGPGHRGGCPGGEAAGVHGQAGGDGGRGLGTCLPHDVFHSQEVWPSGQGCLTEESSGQGWAWHRGRREQEGQVERLRLLRHGGDEGRPGGTEQVAGVVVAGGGL